MESSNSKEAGEILEVLAQDSPDAWLTRQAKEKLAKWRKGQPVPDEVRPGTACSASNPAALPVGLSIDPARGFITGTVAAGADVGSPYSVTVTATDGTYSDSQTFAWTVQHLLLADPGDQTNDDGASVSLPLTATTATGDTLTFGASGLPTGLSIDGGTGLISGTIDPAADAGGPYAVTVTATNSDAFDSQSFTWNVNNPISINPVGDQTNAVGDSASLAVSATTATGDPLTYSASGLPAGLSINASTGLISGTVAVYEAQGTSWSTARWRSR